MMRQQPIIALLILLSLLLANLAACSPGHAGGNEIAFLRDGHLWTIGPDGANAYEVVASSTPIIGYGWSPDHHILVFRTLDEQFAKTSAAKHIVGDPITRLIGDLPADLNTIGIDGGSPLPIIFSSPNVQRSNAWWNTTSTRLLYREESTTTLHNPGTVLWWISQNDQPGGIARKLLPSSFSIPSLAVNSDLAIGNSERGVFTTTLAGTNITYVVQDVLPGHPLSATLERVLWQPAHQSPAILYAIAVASTQGQAGSMMVQLILRSMNGQVTTLATCACVQFAWSPDGKHILYSTGTSYTVLDLTGHTVLTISGEDGSVPYWSPDSQFLLLDCLHSLTLMQIASKRQQMLLSDTTAPAAIGGMPSTGPDANALLQPVSNSPWAADSRHFLFLTHNRLLWRGQHLKTGKGLYTVSISDNGQPQGTPAVVDAGNDTQAGWTYEDPDTSFLF